MTDTNEDRLPPLGEHTPLKTRRGTTPWHRRAAVAGVAGVVVGGVLGFGLSASTDADHEQSAGDKAIPTETTILPTTTTVPTLPPECTEAIRSAEQSLGLLDEAFQTARRLDVGQLDQMLSELQRVRQTLSDRVQACLQR